MKFMVSFPNGLKQKIIREKVTTLNTEKIKPSVCTQEMGKVEYEWKEGVKK